MSEPDGLHVPDGALETMRPQADPVDVDQFSVSAAAWAGLPATMEADSLGLGWTGALVRTYVDDEVADDFQTLATPDLLLVLVEQGAGVVEAWRSGTWNRALYGAGCVGATVANNTSTLRWWTTSPEPMRSTHLHLSGQLVDDTCDATRTHPELPDTLELGDPFVREAARQLSRACRSGASALYADVLAQAVVSHVVESARQRPEGGELVGRGGLGASGMREVTSYMHEHLAEKVSLDDLAAVTNHSKHHFVRLFRAATGTTPHRHLTSIRMARAMEMLRSGATPLSVAHAVGYRSASQFAEAFRGAAGTTPGAFRSQHVQSDLGDKPEPDAEEPVVQVRRHR